MPQFIIRDIDGEIAAKVEVLASSANLSREQWLRELVISATKQPVVKERYSIRVYGINGKGIIRRLGDGAPGGGCSNFSEHEFTAFNKASDFVRRNQPGDREQAIRILSDAFEEVFEQ
jgi:hypothetical protein